MAERSLSESIAITQLLQSFSRFGIKLGLKSTRDLLVHLGNPHLQVPIVHVAGTNGKGSVCAYLSSILTEAGYRVGRYTSPHLVDWTERICINGEAIASSTLLRILQQIGDIVCNYNLATTQFELITAAAWLYFAQQHVDIAVIEVGLGGRLDTTNVCDRPLASVITSIGRDHWQQLGPTLTHIAIEKAGILKPQCPAIIGPLPSEAEIAIAQRIHQLNCPAHWVQPATLVNDETLQYHPSLSLPQHLVSKYHRQNSDFKLQDSDASIQNSGFRIHGSEFNPQPSTLKHSPTELLHEYNSTLTYTIPLLGDHQRVNSALAIATSHILQSQGWSISTQQIRTGLAQTQWPGRLQWIHWQGMKILMDGAHNQAAAATLRRYVDKLPQPIHWIMGMLNTKDHEAIFRELLREGDRLTLVPVPDSATAHPQALATLAQHCCPTLRDCQTHLDILLLLDHISTFSNNHSPTPASDTCNSSGPLTETKVLCGSLYLIGHVLATLNASR